MIATQSLKSNESTLPVKSFLQRLMLFTDGRITDIVQAYSGETVEAIKLSQELISLEQPLPALKLIGKEKVVNRSIVLQGKVSKTNYLYADSVLVLNRLDRRIRDDLVFSSKPIGKLLREYKVETFREILECGIEPARSLAPYFQIEETADIIFRTYRVLIDRSPVMLITEKFPSSHFVD